MYLKCSEDVQTDVDADRLGYKKTWVAQRGRGFDFTVEEALLLAATGFFFCVSYLQPHAFALDFCILGCFSLLPLGPDILGLLKRPLDRQTATRLVIWIIIALAVFFMLTDIYMVSAATHQINNRFFD
jgi:1,4-dihydroxy-2-naphthoate octaprenyltransferase